MTAVAEHRRTATTPSVGLTLALCIALTIAAAFSPGIKFAYHEPHLHASIETTAALVASLAAFLVGGRFSRSGRLDDLLLLCALAILAFTNLVMGAIPAAISAGSLTASWTWVQLTCQLMAAVLLAVAALVPGLVLPNPRASCRLAVVALGVVGASALLVAELGGLPPIGMRSTTGGPPRVDASLVTSIMFASMIAFSLAASGLYRRSLESDDGMLGFVAAGATALTFARLDYFLYPSLDTGWVYVADLMRLLAYALIAAGAAYEISGYWHSLSEKAVLEERRRLARDLHDGLAQELAYISRLSRRTSDDQQPVAIQMAAARALDESRRAIAALTRPLDEPLEVALRQSIEETLGRWERPPIVTLWPFDPVEVDRDRRDALIRIACEAVTNAIRHGQAASVRISVEMTEGRLRMCVVDDGIGFDPAQAARATGCFGISSMRERMAALGGKLRIVSQPRAGTRVEVIF